MMETKQTIGEAVKVLASFSPHKIRIHFFNWRNRTYKVRSMNLFHIEKDGDRQLYHFAISTKDNNYQLVFDPKKLEWQLAEVVQV